MRKLTDKRLHVKQFIGTLKLQYCLAHLYESGEPGYVVIRPLRPNRTEGGLEWAYKKTDFKRGALRRALVV